MRSWPLLLCFAGSYALQLGCSGRSVRSGCSHSLHAAALQVRCGGVAMGLFDGLKAAFANEEFKEDDQRVRASHILVKGDDDVDKIVELMGELGQRVGADQTQLGPVFAELARRESTCGSAAQGGALGSFRPGEMVKEFEAYCFDPATELGALGVIDSEFGTHLVRLEKQNLGVEEGRARGVKGRRMLD